MSLAALNSCCQQPQLLVAGTFAVVSYGSTIYLPPPQAQLISGRLDRGIALVFRDTGVLFRPATRKPTLVLSGVWITLSFGLATCAWVLHT